jgi:hypothetical protein
MRSDTKKGYISKILVTQKFLKIQNHCKMKNTGLMLSETQGLLKNLLDNLSGEHHDYWLKALKKMLRKEEIPEPSAEVLEQIEIYDFRTASIKRIEEIADYIRKIPTVTETSMPEGDDFCLINIGIYINVTDFIYKLKDEDDATFSLKSNGEISPWGNNGIRHADDTFKNWYKKYFKDESPMILIDFCKAVIELGKMYEQSILQIKFK